jgi:hypothetical protein
MHFSVFSPSCQVRFSFGHSAKAWLGERGRRGDLTFMPNCASGRSQLSTESTDRPEFAEKNGNPAVRPCRTGRELRWMLEWR